MSQRLSAVRLRLRRLKTLPVLPTLLTSGNLACGITAILCAAHDLLEAGAIMVFVAMVCDMLDGKVARLTKTDGPFGAQLDSLSDVVSFGVAPAILVHRLVLGHSGVFDHGQRLLWFFTVFYPVMAAIRLARYNVEHSDEATPYFRGIPSPGAAAVLCSWIIFYHHQSLWPVSAEAYQYQGLLFLDSFRWILLGLSIVTALLMVSTVHYPHLGNTLMGRISFRSLIVILALLGGAMINLPAFLVVVTSGYLLYGLLGEAWAMWTRYRKGRNPLDDDEEDDEAVDVGSDSQPPFSGPAPGR